jgi:hypothetical protein
MSDSKDGLTIFRGDDHPGWYVKIQSRLMSEGVWGRVQGTILESEEDKKKHTHTIALEKAVGLIRCYISDEILSNIPDLKLNNAKELLDHLATVYGSKTAGSRLLSLAQLMSLSKSPDETITVWISRVDSAMRKFSSNHDSSYTLKDLKDEISKSIILNGAPDYREIAVTLLTHDVMTKADVEQSLRREETRRAQEAQHASAIAAAAAATVTVCVLCGKGSHPVDKCFKLKAAQDAIKEEQDGTSSSGKSRNN